MLFWQDLERDRIIGGVHVLQNIICTDQLSVATLPLNLCVECTVRPGEVVELVPLKKPCATVDIVGVSEELIDSCSSVRCDGSTLPLAERCGFDIGGANARVFDIPVELGVRLWPLFVRSFERAEVTAPGRTGGITVSLELTLFDDNAVLRVLQRERL